MSIEIEVGLENATKAPRITEEKLGLGEAPKGLANPKVRRLLMGGGAVVVATIVGLFAYFHNRETTDDAQVDGHITPMASKVYGRVAQVLVDDNQAVRAGQVLVKIDPRDYQAAVDQAKASLALAESEARAAGGDGPRTRGNGASGKSSADAQWRGAEAGMEQARAGVALAHADIKQVNMKAADAQAKLAKVEQARASLEAAELNLSYTEITAPVDGVATHKQVETGQIVQAGQGLLVVVPLQNVWVTANFKETQLRKMKAGQRAEVKVDTYGK